MTVRAVGVHCYAGPMARGVRDAGVDVVATLEPEEYRGFGRDSVAANLPGTEFVLGEDAWRPRRFRGAVDLVFGNPPCAGFSRLGRGKSGGRSKKTDSYRRHFTTASNLLAEVRPRVLALESVRMLETTGAGICATVENQARDLGYSVTYWRHDQKCIYGAQRRERVFMIVHDVNLSFPIVPGPDYVPPVVGDVIDGPVGMFKPLSEKHARLLALTPPGSKPRTTMEKMIGWVMDEEEFRSKYGFKPSFLVVRLSRDASCPTMIPDHHKYVHPDYERPIGHLEMSRIAGFSDDWLWTGKTVSQIWNEACKACQPGPARALGEVVAKSLEDPRPPRYAVAIADQSWDNKRECVRDDLNVLVPNWDLAP